MSSRTAAWLLMLSLVGWGFLAWIAFDMGHPVARLTMPMSSAWHWDNLLAVWCMWAVMMAAMMLPSALPMVQAFVALCRRNSDIERSRSFVSAYLLVWFAFSMVATGLQWLLQAALGRLDDRQHVGRAHGRAAARGRRLPVLAAQTHLPCKLPHANGLPDWGMA